MDCTIHRFNTFPTSICTLFFVQYSSSYGSLNVAISFCQVSIAAKMYRLVSGFDSVTGLISAGQYGVSGSKLYELSMENLNTNFHSVVCEILNFEFSRAAVKIRTLCVSCWLSKTM